MKKLLAYILLVCMILSLAACSPATDKQNEITDNNKAGNVNSGFLRMVQFRSIEELVELKEKLTKSEEENFTPFHSRQEADYFFEDIGNLPILHLEEASGYDLTYIEYDIYNKIITTAYENDYGYLRFQRYLPDSRVIKYAVNTDEKESSPLPIAKEKLTIFNKPITFEVVDDEEDIYRVVSVFSLFDSKVRFMLADNTKSGFDLEAIEANIVETTINKLIEQNQIE